MVSTQTIGRTFPPGSWDSMREWISKRSGEWNLYFSVNGPKPNSPNKRLEKFDIAAIRAIYVDLDPAKDGTPLDQERERLAKIVTEQSEALHPPSALIDSGGGFQLFWFLGEKLDAAKHMEWAESQGRGIAKKLGGDAVQNIDRVMRLPGTINLPDAKKKARGRVPTPARLKALTEDAYSPAELREITPPVGKASSTSDLDREIDELSKQIDVKAIKAVAHIEELPAGLWDRFKAARARDPKLEALWRGDESALPGKDRTGSAYRGALACYLQKARGFTAQDFGHLLWVWDHAVQQGSREDAIDKLPKEFARVALAFHHFEWYTDELAELLAEEPPEFISAATARRARRFLTEFVLPHTAVFYERLIQSRECDAHARWIAGHILSHERKMIRERDIDRAYSARKGLMNRGKRLAAMYELEVAGWVMACRYKADGKPDRWTVNPAVFDGRFAEIADSEAARRLAVREAIAAEGAKRREAAAEETSRCG